MKNVKFFLLTALFLSVISQLKAQNLKINFQSIFSKAPASSSNPTCMVTVQAYLHYTGYGKLVYYWIRNDGTQTPYSSVFLPTGKTEQYLYDSWNVKVPFDGWEELVITSPNNFTSPHAAINVIKPNINPPSNNNGKPNMPPHH